MGFKCTNTKCSRVFTTAEEFKRHKQHHSQVGKFCSHEKCGAKLFEVPVRGAGLRHTKTILVPLYSGDVSLLPLISLWRRHRFCGAGAKSPQFYFILIPLFYFATHFVCAQNVPICDRCWLLLLNDSGVVKMREHFFLVHWNPTSFDPGGSGRELISK